MEVLAISNNPGAVKRNLTAGSMSFGNRDEAVEAMAYRMAVDKTVAQAKNRQKNIKRLFYSVPLLAGISAAILSKGNSKVLDTEISGLAGRLSEGIKSGGRWVGLIGLGAAIGIGDAAIAKKSEGFRNFRNNHPFLSFVGDVGVYLASAVAIAAGFSKLGAKIKPMPIYDKMSKGIQNVAGHVNSIKTPKFIKNISTKISNMIPDAIKNISNFEFVKKVGAAIKGIGIGILKFAPDLALLAAVFEEVSSRAKSAADLERNYNDAKRIIEEA